MKSDKVIKPKVAGGLGLGSLGFKNWSMFAKWWWRFGEERDALWRRVIVEKYGWMRGGGFVVLDSY